MVCVSSSLKEQLAQTVGFSSKLRENTTRKKRKENIKNSKNGEKESADTVFWYSGFVVLREIYVGTGLRCTIGANHYQWLPMFCHLLMHLVLFKLSICPYENSHDATLWLLLLKTVSNCIIASAIVIPQYMSECRHKSALWLKTIA